MRPLCLGSPDGATPDAVELHETPPPRPGDYDQSTGRAVALVDVAIGWKHAIADLTAS